MADGQHQASAVGQRPSRWDLLLLTNPFPKLASLLCIGPAAATSHLETALVMSLAAVLLGSGLWWE